MFFLQRLSLIPCWQDVQAFGISTSLVVAAAVIGGVCAPKDRAQAMSTYQTLLYPFSPLAMVGSLISAMSHWQSAFAVVAVAGIATFVYNKAILGETLEKGVVPRKITIRTFKSILANRAAFAIILLAFSQFYGYYIFLVFLPMLITVY